MLLVKLSGEISIKSKAVRRRFVSTLINNIKIALETNKIEIKRISIGGGRLFIECKKEKKAISILKNIFGVHSICLAEYYKGANIKNITKNSLAFAKKILKRNDSFAIRCKRVGIHNFTSKKINEILGKKILKNIKGLKVNLEKPKKELFIEIRDSNFYLYNREIYGFDGLPIGVEGNTLLIPNKFQNDIICCWLMSRRGCKIFILKDKNSKKIIKYLREWNSFKDIREVEKRYLESEIKRNRIISAFSSKTSGKIKNTFSYKNIKLPLLMPLLFFPKERFSYIKGLILK